MQQLKVRKPPFMSIRYSVRGDVGDIYQSLLKGYGSSTVLLFSVLPFFSLLHGDSPFLYSPFEVIRALHLLIIWTFTWVHVPSDIPPIFLWVVVAKTTLFTSPLHINVARKVAAIHLMWQLQPHPWHPTLSSFLRACGTHPCY